MKSTPTGSGSAVGEESGFEIRPGRRDDVKRAAALLYESAGPMAAAALGLGDPARALAALERIYRQRGGIFSHDVCLLAESGDRVIGIVASCRLDELQSRNLATVLPLLRSLGPAKSLTLLRRGLLPTGLGPRSLVPRSWRRRGETPMVTGVGSADLYIIALAVAPSFRRLGFAQRLLERVRSEALASGAESITVNVLEQNAAARSIYRQLGFRRVRRFQPESPEFVGSTEAVLTLQFDLGNQSPSTSG